MKRILEISTQRPGDPRSEVIDLADVNARVSGNQSVFTGHATVRSRFRDNDFSDFYQIIRGLREATGALTGDRVKIDAAGRQNETGS